MAEFICLMHSDATRPTRLSEWDNYLNRLKALDCFNGGSEIGDGRCYRRDGEPLPVTLSVGGFIRIEAANLAEARKLLDGNPVFEAGGTVEIRELPPS